MKHPQKKTLKQKLWTLFSRYIRQRDKGKCFSCGNIRHWEQQQAGHFRHGTWDFDERNINCQCVRCNKWLHGNLGTYAVRLIEKYGMEVIREIEKEEPYRPRAWYLEKITYYSKLLGMKEVKGKSEQCVLHRRKQCTICHRSKKVKVKKKSNDINID